MRPHLIQKIQSLPDTPGVYLMKDAEGTIFYIGKAKSLRNRVRSYFSGSDTRAFVALLDGLLEDVEVILTRSDAEAFLLENELIKAHRPRFNVQLTDDKRYLCLRLDIRQAYPRLQVVRTCVQDGARYFGPYHAASALRATLALVNKHFQLRTCSDQVMRTRSRPCLQYQIKRCPAPCVLEVSQASYRAHVNDVIAFLEGRTSELLTQLNARMHQYAEAWEFEAAAAVRSQIRAVERSVERQRWVSHDFVNRDVIGLYRQGPAIEIHVMRMREGTLIDAQRFSLADTEVPTSEVLADFAGRCYAQALWEGPHEILFPSEMEWDAPLAQILSEKTGHPVQVLVPQRGFKRRLVDLAITNARQAFIDKQRQAGAARTALEALKQALHLPDVPVRIECFDISHLQGSWMVASAVRFEQGVPCKAMYRHYKIRSTPTQDDFQSIYEVISRRARRGLENNDWPDLMVIDGGKGQLHAARAALQDHGMASISVVGLAKSRLQVSNRSRSSAAAASTRSPERIFVWGCKEPLVLRSNSAELFILTRIRDEAHRFALAFHRKLRGKASVRSSLDAIPGLGPQRRRALLRTFGSVSQLRAASEGDIAQVVGPKLASVLVRHWGPLQPNPLRRIE